MKITPGFCFGLFLVLTFMYMYLGGCLSVCVREHEHACVLCVCMPTCMWKTDWYQKFSLVALYFCLLSQSLSLNLECANYGYCSFASFAQGYPVFTFKTLKLISKTIAKFNSSLLAFLWLVVQAESRVLPSGLVIPTHA